MRKNRVIFIAILLIFQVPLHGSDTATECITAQMVLDVSSLKPKGDLNSLITVLNSKTATRANLRNALVDAFTVDQLLSKKRSGSGYDAGFEALDSYIEEHHPAKWKSWERLLLDIGILSHAQEFIQYLKSNSENLPDDFEVLREEFSRSLGKRTVYRAILATPDKARKIKETFLDCLELCRFNMTKAKIDHTLTESAAAQSMKRVFKGLNWLMSVTDHPEIALAAAFSQSKDNVSDRAYLFKIEIPELDLMSGVYGQQLDAVTLEVHFPGGKKIFSSGIESFVQLRIDRNEITEMREIQGNWEDYNFRPIVNGRSL